MALETVRVPEGMAPLFEKAEHVVSEYFSRRKEQPAEGTIEIFDERYVLMRGAALSVEFFSVTRDLLGPGREAEADEFARNILFDVAHAMGKSDARNFHRKMGLVDPIEKLSAGPVHFAHAGWAFVDISPESVPGSEEEYYLLYDHPYSFESDAWMRAGKTTDFPVCIMNAGYSSGWCEESFEVNLVSSELLCRARGDECCRFIMAHPRHIERRVKEYLKQEPALAPRVGEYKIPDLFVRKRLEDELLLAHRKLRAANDELEARVQERTEELRQAGERLALEIEEKNSLALQLVQTQKLEALGRLAGGIAHDFNNLLTIINGCSELILEEHKSDSATGGLAEEIARAGARASRLTEQLLVFSKQQVTTTENVDLAVVVSSMCDLLQRLLGEQIQMATHIAPAGECLLKANPSQIEQVILNLAVNARDAMPNGGTMSIAVDLVHLSDRIERPWVQLEMEDDGEGMDEETRKQIFDPFFTTKSPGKGTGLGLSTVYGIVQQAGGRIEVHSEKGNGARFTLLFPLADADSSQTEEPFDQPEVSARYRHTILLVEDETSVRHLLARSLEKAGFSVLSAENALKAQEVFEKHADAIELLLTDVVMPGPSGVELARTLRASAPKMKIVLMSGYADDRIDESDLQLDGVTFVAKPLNLKQLRRLLREMLSPRAS